MNIQILNAKTWEERYRLLIQAGKKLPRPEIQQLSQMQEISGCEARLWFQFEEKTDHTFQFSAYSEARIMNGLLYLLLNEINGKTRKQLNEFDIVAFFNQLGITQRLSETRLNGLKQIGKQLCSL
ncbi:SufE family protein [Rodentibacter caecimuris]|uniref:Fe-S metabolism associated domain-containing protein n=1 Tax=Rodentibacter caecimuris TaxID=1796644 RepID=A0ABX3KXJ8_9PAST|nr:hypothetical protein BKG89_06490 [Rodentibacter heylii]